MRHRVSRRLDKLSFYGPNPVERALIGFYELAYEGGPGTERTFLKSVYRYDAALHRMWERRFEWAHAALPEFDVVDPPQLAGAFHETSPFLFDSDNDGREDILIDGKFCRTSKGSPVPFDKCASGSATANLWGRPIDVDGNGRADIIQATAAGTKFATWNDATGTFEPTLHGVAPSANMGDARRGRVAGCLLSHAEEERQRRLLRSGVAPRQEHRYGVRRTGRAFRRRAVPARQASAGHGSRRQREGGIARRVEPVR